MSNQDDKETKNLLHQNPERFREDSASKQVNGNGSSVISSDRDGTMENKNADID